MARVCSLLEAENVGVRGHSQGYSQGSVVVGQRLWIEVKSQVLGSGSKVRGQGQRSGVGGQRSGPQWPGVRSRITIQDQGPQVTGQVLKVGVKVYGSGVSGHRLVSGVMSWGQRSVSSVKFHGSGSKVRCHGLCQGSQVNVKGHRLGQNVKGNE